MVSTHEDLGGITAAVSAFMSAMSAANSNSDESLHEEICKRKYSRKASNLFSIMRQSRFSPLPRPKSEHSFPMTKTETPSGTFLGIQNKPFHRSALVSREEEEDTCSVSVCKAPSHHQSTTTLPALTQGPEALSENPGSKSSDSYSSAAAVFPTTGDRK